MIIVTTKNADNTYKARINGFDTTITRDEIGRASCRERV